MLIFTPGFHCHYSVPHSGLNNALVMIMGRGLIGCWMWPSKYKEFGISLTQVGLEYTGEASNIKESSKISPSKVFCRVKCEHSWFGCFCCYHYLVEISCSWILFHFDIRTSTPRPDGRHSYPHNYTPPVTKKPMIYCPPRSIYASTVQDGTLLWLHTNSTCATQNCTEWWQAD